MNSFTQETDLATGIQNLDFSIRTYNRLRKMGIANLEHVAHTPPAEFMVVEGFGKKCLHEVALVLELLYSSLDASRLARFANVVELWRPYFRHPERVPHVPLGASVEGRDYVVSNPGTAEPEEPFDPGLHLQAQMAVDDLPITARARNVLRSAGIRSVHDLAEFDPDSFAKMDNCGKRTVKELASLLRQYFVSLPNSSVEFYRKSRASWLRYAGPGESGTGFALPIFLQHQTHSLAAVIESSLATTGERRTSILVKRLGLSQGQSRKTLEAIGREFGLTRERVRQIVDKGLELILRNVKTHRPDISPEIRKFIRGNGVVSLDQVAGAIANLGSSELIDSRACARLVLFADPEDWRPLDSAGNAWASRDVTAEFHRKVLRAAQAVLDGIPMTCALAAVEVAKSLRQFDDSRVVMIQKLLLTAPGKLRIEVSSEGPMLYPPRQNNSDRRRPFIHAYIKEQGVPVQMREILSALQDSAPELIPDSPSRQSAINAIASSMERDDRFAWAGMSTWGLREWGYVSRGSSVSAAIVEVLRASSTPLSTAQIREELCHLYRVSGAVVYAALKSSEGEIVARNSEGLWHLI
ncbi:MAG: DNA-directed RNA polymerase subunit alpha C-terminal domain-containing protein [Candidatus Acidiferrales bacterium]